jgi:mono/diheme cytochrome c family protein
VISETPTPPARVDLQIPGLVVLVEDFNIPPVIPDDPGLVDIGENVYYQICLACHGDWGQGLTDGWRATWGEDENCWQSKCHATNHPAEGFELPHIVPPVLGAGSMDRWRTAEELHEYIARTMPWWKPGSLTEEEAWGVTAYLLQKRGELADVVTLDTGNSPIIRLHTPASEPVDYRPRVLLIIAMLTITMVAFTMIKRGSS